MKKKYIILALILLISVFVSSLLIKGKEEDKDDTVKEIIKEEEKEVNTLNCYVDIKGAVVNSNVYECKENEKVIDIINKAGGLTSDADTSLINLSKKITDQMTIIIYTKKQVSDAKNRLNEPKVKEIIKEIEKECNCLDSINDGCINGEDNTTKVNINTASIEQLMTLPGIGESKANQIISYRTSTPFTKIQDIKNVTGIGDSIFESIKDYITI